MKENVRNERKHTMQTKAFKDEEKQSTLKESVQSVQNKSACSPTRPIRVKAICPSHNPMHGQQLTWAVAILRPDGPNIRSLYDGWPQSALNNLLSSRSPSSNGGDSVFQNCC